MMDTMMLAAKAQPKEWEGAKSAKFTTVKRHIAPHQPVNGAHPLFDMGGRAHYEQKRDEQKEFKPLRKVLKAPTLEGQQPKGMHRIVADYVIVKPKIERLQLQHGVTPEDLKDFVGPRNFLTKYKGVKQQKLDTKLEQDRAMDRQKRTFTQAGISVVTSNGEKTLTINNAQTVKHQMNAEREARKTAKKMAKSGSMQNAEPFVNEIGNGLDDQYLDDQDLTESQLNAIGTAHYQERADLEVEALDDWERQHMVGAQDSDSDDQ